VTPNPTGRPRRTVWLCGCIVIVGDWAQAAIQANVKTVSSTNRIHRPESARLVSFMVLLIHSTPVTLVVPQLSTHARTPLPRWHFTRMAAHTYTFLTEWPEGCRICHKSKETLAIGNSILWFSGRVCEWEAIQDGHAACSEIDSQASIEHALAPQLDVGPQRAQMVISSREVEHAERDIVPVAAQRPTGKEVQLPEGIRVQRCRARARQLKTFVLRVPLRFRAREPVTRWKTSITSSPTGATSPSRSVEPGLTMSWSQVGKRPLCHRASAMSRWAGSFEICCSSTVLGG